MTSEMLGGIAGTGLSLIMSYLPWARKKYEKLDGNGKRLVMLGLLALTAAGIYGLTCAGVQLGSTWTCNGQGAIEAIKAFGAAAIANQATFSISPKPAQPTA